MYVHLSQYRKTFNKVQPSFMIKNSQQKWPSSDDLMKSIYKKAWLTLLSEKATAPHSSALAWKIPWTEVPGRLPSVGSLRVRHDWAISLSLFTFMHWRRKWQPTPVFLPGESQGRGSLVGCVYGVTQSRTRLKRLSSSSSNITFNTERINALLTRSGTKQRV